MSYNDYLEQYFTFSEDDVEAYEYQEAYLTKERIKLHKRIRKLMLKKRQKQFKLKEIRLQGKFVIIEDYF